MCDLCQDRGYIIDDNKTTKKCICTAKKEIEAMLSDLTKYQLNKNISYEALNTNLTIIEGVDLDFYSLIKSYLFKRYFHELTTRTSYSIITGYSLVESYLAGNLPDYYDIPLLFIDLTKFCSNKLLGETILYLLQQREFKSVITWSYIKTITPNVLAEHYSQPLTDFIFAQKTISLQKYNLPNK